MAQLLAKTGNRPRLFLNERRREALAGYLFILPSFLGYFVFIIGPILAAVGLSFTSYDILNPPKFIGLDNYSRMLKDPRLLTVYENTIVFTFFAVILNVGVGLFLAVLINRHMPKFLTYIFRTVYFFPVLISLAYCAVIWQFLYQKDTGIVNYYLGIFGVSPVPWLSSNQLVLPSIIIMDVWKNTGYFMLLFIAGLQAIPTSYYEAARLDGANRFQVFRHITVPQLSPTIFFCVTISLIGALQVFDSIIVLTGGGPGDASRSLVMYIVENAFQKFQLGYASAISLTLFILIMLLTLLQFRLSRLWVHYE